MQSEITERAKTAWNSIADEFNQWDALGLDEQETYVALTAALSDKQAVEVKSSSDVCRAASALLDTLWQLAWSGARTQEENWAEMDKRFPQARWLHEALKAQTAALVDVPAVESTIPTANCCVCGRIIDTREKSEGGDNHGDETAPGKWTCSVACYDAFTGYAPDVPAVEPVAWRVIEGYEGLYEVSSGGDVRSIQTGKLLAKNLAGSGYVKADLWKNGKRWQTTVHRLVADAFLEKQGTEINHINGVKTDNRVNNLEWCTRSENVSHSVYVLSNRVRPVVAYNPATGETRHYRSVCEAARDGFKSSQIYRALKNPNRSVKGFRWQEAHLSPALAATRSGSATTAKGVPE